MNASEPINYNREAFLHPVNLGFLFASALTAFFLNDVGMMSQFIFTMAIGTELVYLGVVPRSEFFRRFIQKRSVREPSRRVEEREIFYNLEARSQKRFLVLRHISDKISANFKKFPYTSKGLIETIQKKIDELLSNYVVMLDSFERYAAYIKATRESELRGEIAELETEIQAAESDKLRQIKSRRMSILRKRLEKLAAAHERLEICESQLETIEDAMRYIYEQSITLNNPEQIGFQLDNLLNDVEETVTIVEDLEEDVLPGFNLLEKMENEMQNADIGTTSKEKHRTQ